MSWTYDGDLTNRRDRIRFLVGDTDTNDQLLQDGEINYHIEHFPNDYLCAAVLCDAIAAKFSRQADVNNAGLSLSASQRAQAYRTRAVELRKEATKIASMSVGTQYRHPAFWKGMFDREG